MKATFLVTLNIQPDESLASISAEISDKLEADLEVIMVKPWSRPKTAPDGQGQAVLRHFLTLYSPGGSNATKTEGGGPAAA